MRNMIPEQLPSADVTFIHAENLAMGADDRKRAIATAHQAIQQVVETWQSTTCI